MTILGIHFSPLELTVIGGFSWLGLCILLAWFLCRRGGPYDRPDYEADQAQLDADFAPLSCSRREEYLARLQ